MGDLVVLEDMPTPESSVPLPSSGDINSDANAKLPRPVGAGTVNDAPDSSTPKDSDNQDVASAGDSAETVNTCLADVKTLSSSSPIGSKTEQSILQPHEVSLPKVKALRVTEKPESNTSPKSAKSVDVDHSPRSLQPGIGGAPNKFQSVDSSRVVVDTAAPIESVKDAVSKFGGIVDWKTHKVQTLERRRCIDQELEKAQEEMCECRKRSQAAEDANMEVQNELERTIKQIEELELQLKRHVIADESGNTTVKQELEAVVAQHEAALAELKSAKDELEVVKNDLALRRVGEAPEDVEKAVQELTVELSAAKESLAAAQAAYIEAEDLRKASVAAREQDVLSWERELKQVEGEVEKLKQERRSAEDLQSELDSASALFSSLQAELASYIASKMKQETEDVRSKAEAENSKRKLASAKKEVELVKLKIEKAAAEVGILKQAASSLQSELDTELEAVVVMKKRGGIATVTVQSLEAELSTIKSEMTLVEMRKKEDRAKSVDLAIKLQQAAEEADHAKSLKQAVHDELRRARDEAEQAKAEACTTQTRLHATEKEIEASEASGKLALAAISALQETEAAQAKGDVDPENVVIISLEEYMALSKRAQEAEEHAKTRLAAALIQIEAAKECESESLQKLEEVSRELSAKKGGHSTATKKSEKAMNDKLRMEQELRSWRTKNEQRRKASESASFTSESAVYSPRSIKQRKDAKKSGKVVATEPHHDTHSPKSVSVDQSSVEYNSSPDVKVVKKKKRSLFPRLLMFFGKHKSHASKKAL
uniref:Uncharacterized protein n=1 Tax=Kalanchoe fedtschenkoi TaxID=63787 RepID=A0A7N0V5Y4_KALFE